MRLIDADKLLRPGYTDMFDEPITFDMVSKEAIDREPTVEAIPVEWIKERMNKEEYRGFLVDHIEWHECLCWLIGKWRDENEQRQDS